jgi:predicted outer membrane lipoprotein
LSLSSNLGLKLANAFGVFLVGLKLANAFGVFLVGLKLGNASGVSQSDPIPQRVFVDTHPPQEYHARESTIDRPS